MASSNTPSLMGIARELRDMIYEEYLTFDGGLVYNHATRKLRPANRDSNSSAKSDGDTNICKHTLALTYSCRQIAREMQGLVLRINPISFSTAFSEEASTRAYRFQVLQEDQKQTISCMIRDSLKLQLITPDIIALAARKYPHSQDVLTNMVECFRHQLWGENPMRVADHGLYLAHGSDELHSWDVFRHVLELLQARGRLPPCKGFQPEVIAVSHKPWDMPNTQALDDWQKLLGREEGRWHGSPSDSCRPKLCAAGRCMNLEAETLDTLAQWRFSAAAEAIGFLHTLSPTLRSYIRRIVLNEDYPISASGTGYLELIRKSLTQRGCLQSSSACHGRGLVCFCEENKDLRIERRINLWRCVFGRPLQCQCFNPIYILWGVGKEDPWYQWRRVELDVGFWLNEAGRLPAHFTITFDGKPAPTRSAEMFKCLVHFAAYQDAMERCFERNILPTPKDVEECTRAMTDDELASYGPGALSPEQEWHLAHRCWHHWQEYSGAWVGCGFPIFIRSLVHESNVGETSRDGPAEGPSAAVVRCNFPIAAAWDAEAMIADRLGWSAEEWERDCLKVVKEDWDAVWQVDDPSVPNGHDLALEAVASPEHLRFWREQAQALRWPIRSSSPHRLRQ